MGIPALLRLANADSNADAGNAAGGRPRV